jgi:ferredoxin-NADP reductase
VSVGEVEKWIDVRLNAIRYAARDTNVFEFGRPDGSSLPTVTPGSHIDVVLTNGIVRQYSLMTSGSDLHSYSVGVKRDAKSRGGSSFMHDSLRVGAAVKIGEPRNHFPLAQNAPFSVFVAGGIGITPIYCMVQHLLEIKAPFSLYYACRSRSDAAFIDVLEKLPQVTLSLDDEQQAFLDFGKIIAEAPFGSHFYCCGPIAMLQSFEAACAVLPLERVHVEYFSPIDVPATEGGYTVELARSGKQFFIPHGKTILDVLCEAGIAVSHACQQGVCGSCETRVLDGEPDHRDAILNENEKAANNTMMICCSGSKSARLVLDL